ncbi:alpha/beta hydrolase [Paenibacillus sp. YPG26]|uniref:alpha/beta fold hydrolase n=1 Tax=Paenibacillus sp. YPG26 TaxID=2878915 RepID=UPI00203BE984|nr:alpha/beta hydrolase [Paenibacillus sp. YPG26]USB32300.1 alpha/beta hydrolase [Paenibacillus sp. YPG26]
MDTSLSLRKLYFKNEDYSYIWIPNEGQETILMLHPAFADYTIFEQQIAHFKRNYQLILLDLPGHGSRSLPSSKVTLQDVPELLHQILSEHQIRDCHLLGVSAGSLAAQAFADRYPHEVKSVTIVGGYSIHKANEAVLKGQRKEGLRWLLYMLQPLRKFREYVTSVSCHTAECKVLFAQGSQHFRRRSFRSMAGMNTFFISKDTPMPYPLLIVVGEFDLPIILTAADELHQLEMNSRLVQLPGAGHCANADMPYEFNKAVEHFLSEIH